MDNSSTIAVSRLIVQQRAMEVSADNLANANTPGYRAERVQFADWLSKQPTGTAARGEPKLDYVQDRATWRESQAGTFEKTGNPFDMAISGEGFFTVSTASGPRLTRAGRFGPLPDGTLADEAGNKLMDVTGQPLRLAATDTQVSIAADGTVSSQSGAIGRVGIVVPADPMQMKAEGARLFQANSPTAQVPAAQVVQGAVEDSNVAPVMELTRMMNLSREFQFTTQFVQAEADRKQSAIDKILPHQGS
jgi:flagellar basal-body rod protein FlgF